MSHQGDSQRPLACNAFVCRRLQPVVAMPPAFFPPALSGSEAFPAIGGAIASHLRGNQHFFVDVQAESRSESIKFEGFHDRIPEGRGSAGFRVARTVGPAEQLYGP